MSADAVQFDFPVFAAEDWPLKFNIKDSAGALKDVTGASAIWVLKRSPDGQELLRKTTISGIANGGAAGTLTVDVTDSETQNLRAGVYYHELNITLSEITRKAAYGAVTVHATGIRT